MILTEKFEVHDILNPKLWTSNNKLYDDVKTRIVEIVNQFLSTSCEDVPLNIVDIRLVGSQASYNYNQYSDLDVHIITNFDLLPASKEIIQALYNALKAKFNSDYNITLHGIDVELYVEDVNSNVTSNGIYSVINDSWIKFPKKLTEIPQVDISKEILEWEQKITQALNSNDSELVISTINDLYILRKDSILLDGEYGVGNQIFKELRNRGYLDNLKDSYKHFRSKELTLEHLILTEASRTDLLSKSKKSDKGFQRFKKRVKSRIANSVKQYNAIDMNKLFKQDILTVDVQVKGETDTYTVTMSYGGFLELLHDQLEKTGEFNLKAVTRALINGFNRDDVYIHCNCPDATYRMNFWQTKNKVNSGPDETRPSNITNPTDSLGAGCKHVLLVLSNTSWILKVASVIYNYVNYMEKHYERLYQKIIYPAIYQQEYDEMQLSMFDDEDNTLNSDSETIDKSNIHAKTKNQFKSGNEYRFKPDENKNQMTIDDDVNNNEDINENEDEIED